MGPLSTTTDTHGPLAADACMTIGPDGSPCHLADFHAGLHSWQAAPTEPAAKHQPVKVVMRAPTEEEFDGADFLASVSMERVADRLIAESADLTHLEGIRVAYLWKRHGGSTGGNRTLGKCQKPSGLLAHFSEVDYVVWLAADHALDLGFSAVQLEALLFHELLHTDIEENEDTGAKKLTTRGHDVEEFGAVIRKYGLWDRSLLEVGHTIRQLKLEDAG